MAQRLPAKAPGEIITYAVDFSAVLNGAEIIESIISEVVDAGLTVVTAINTPTTGLDLLVSGGSELETYRIVILVETDTGTPKRRIERAFCVTVKPQPC